MAHRTLVAVFDHRGDAERARQDLIQEGFSASDVRISEPRVTATEVRHEDKGFWESLKEAFGFGDENEYEEAARRGGVVLSLRAAEDRLDRAADVVNRYNPADMDRKAEEWRAAGWRRSGHGSTSQTAATAPATTMAASASRAEGSLHEEAGRVIPVVEEQLNVGKRVEKRGGVRIATHVTQAPVEEQVQLRDETVRVERRAADRPLGAGADAFREQTIEVAETDEVPVISKQARVVEEVVVNKDVDTRTETVRDTVKRTDVDVERLDEDEFRKDFDRSYAGRGHTFDQYRPAYTYGQQLATDQRYHGRDWGVVEPEARKSFEEKNPGKWDDYKNAVRYGWDRARAKAR